MKIAYDRLTAAAAILLAAGLAGCGLTNLSGSAGTSPTGPPVPLTERVAPSALVAVAPGAAVGPALSQLVAATARPREYLDIIVAAAQPDVLVASDSPAPATAVVRGQPGGPGAGATAYQEAGYRKRLEHWYEEIKAGTGAVGARTRADLSRWVRGLRIPARLAGRAGQDPADLAEECALASSALAGLDQASGDRFGSRRVLVLYAASLGGVPPAGELIGDDVIVVTRFLPSAAAASAAQTSLLRAGAAQATVLGPEATAAQLADLVSSGLSQHVFTEALSGPALFDNNSAVLLPRAVRVLTPLLHRLRRAGVTAVINGYASTPGSVSMNYRLSYARAAAVAAFFEASGISASCLVVVGHGAEDLVAPGASGANRRVTVVIEEPFPSWARSRSEPAAVGVNSLSLTNSRAARYETGAWRHVMSRALSLWPARAQRPLRSLSIRGPRPGRPAPGAGGAQPAWPPTLRVPPGCAPWC
ncbi:MAG TPA: OmpA family protein [Streptosporangiaceae bacterium]|jgi:outer membrane protein OmpA-like peptidoglycan-associated protein|nr:OmpA family protein [Streptosporangiaceae bacterium]